MHAVQTLSLKMSIKCFEEDPPYCTVHEIRFLTSVLQSSLKFHEARKMHYFWRALMFLYSNGEVAQNSVKCIIETEVCESLLALQWDAKVRPSAMEISIRRLWKFLSFDIKRVSPAASAPVLTGPPHGHPLPPDYGPPPYEATLQPGFVPPHVPGESAMPKPTAVPMPMYHPHGGFTNRTQWAHLCMFFHY